MTCVRASNISSGSRVAAALPSPTALRSIPKHLSKRIVAAIAVASIVAVVLVAGALLWMWFARRRRLMAEKRSREEELLKVEEEQKKEALNPMLDGETLYETGGKERQVELDGVLVSELEGSGVPEMDGSSSRR